MARPRKADAMEVLSIRVPAETIAALDRYTEHLRSETPLLRIDRPQALRVLLDRALREFARPSKQSKRA